MKKFWSSVFEDLWNCRILILWVLSVNKIYILHPQFFPTVLKCPKIAGANSLFFNIAGAKAPIAPIPGVFFPVPVLLLFRKSFVSATGFSFERVNLRADGEPTGVFSIKE